jgi:hypothetical protein
MIKVQCPNMACGKYSAVKEEFAGKRAKCPACGTVISIPSSSSEPAAPPAQSPAEEEREQVTTEPRKGRARDARLTGIAMASFVLGGLVLAYSIWFLIWGEAGSAGHPRIGGNLPEQVKEKIAKAFEEEAAKIPGVTRTRWTLRLMMLISVVALVWSALAIGAGVGLWQRRKWGWMLGLVTGGCAVILAVATLVPMFLIGYWVWLVNFLLYAAYAVAAFLILTQAGVKEEFR